MSLNLPTETQIAESLEQVFNRAFIGHSEHLLSALLTIDKTSDVGGKTISYVTDYEMTELCSFINGFNDLLKRTDDKYMAARIHISIYAHIMEADLPLTVIWNLLRVLVGKPCDWTFHRLTKDGKIQVCEYPRDKIYEISKISKQAHASIGSILNSIWIPELRNTFSHSQYFWIAEIYQSTVKMSPISRKPGAKGAGPAFNLTEILSLYNRSQSYLLNFIALYKNAMNMYKTGHSYHIHDGWVVWDADIKQWRWSKRK